MLIGWISKVECTPTNGATLPLLTSCIAASEKFEVNKQPLFGDKNWSTYFDICSFHTEIKHRSCYS